MTILRDHLKTIEPKTFLITMWVNNFDRYQYAKERNKLLFTDAIDINELPCGSTACVLGHATMIPEFQKLGLHLQILDGEVHVIYGEPCTSFTQLVDSKTPQGTMAGAKFFDIQEWIAHLFFYTKNSSVPFYKYYQRLLDPYPESIRHIPLNAVILALTDFLDSDGQSVEQYKPLYLCNND